MIIDCQSVKSVEGGEAIGFDAGKKVHGRKRVLLTDGHLGVCQAGEGGSGGYS